MKSVIAGIICIGIGLFAFIYALKMEKKEIYESPDIPKAKGILGGIAAIINRNIAFIG